MSLSWVTLMPTWLFGVLIIALIVAIGQVGLYTTRKWVRAVHGERYSHNDVVGYYVGALCAFYGITLGLIAVATWQAYSDANARVGEEAAMVGTLYEDISVLPDPNRTQLQDIVRQYTRQVIDVAWPWQRRGVLPKEEGKTLKSLEESLMRLEPTSDGQKVAYSRAFRDFGQVVLFRGSRLQNVHRGLPGPLWAVVVVGAFVMIAVTWFFDLRSHSLHVWMTLMLSVLLGLLIYLLVSLDNPFQGDVSVTPEPFELLYQRRMTTEK